MNGPTFTVLPDLCVINTFLPTTIDAACESSSVLGDLSPSLPSSPTALTLYSHFFLPNRFTIAFRVVDLLGFSSGSLLFSSFAILFTTETINS